MIREIALDTVEFVCPSGHPRWSEEHHVVHYEDADGGQYEFFSLQGVPVPSPYTIDGAPPCPECGGLVLGRMIARRFLEIPNGTRTDAGAGRYAQQDPVPVDRRGGQEPPPYWPGPS
ncbi:hypothetical protein [Pseudonocardia acidicola]|uniref:Uncharacterized protein n=1 Tax=Pseudonocardia acidicola TaxID=2724939 RepID=A0ABX1S2Z6_9PSEU|nr:hypothetical protein [Pseudonocardia acidicola]NMH95946.1 hypothetical protein [Pseudonocardia acidicola]